MISLRGGDFHVYYSENDKGENKIPRIAIRMEGDSIAEVRGIEPNQNTDKYVLPVVEERMNEFGEEGVKYKKKVEDIEKLTEIYNKCFEKINDGSLRYLSPDLSMEELIFIYEINNKINNFGYGDDPRIENILENRNVKKDMALIFKCSEGDVVLKKEELFNKEVQVFYSKEPLVVYNEELESGLQLPKKVIVGTVAFIDNINFTEEFSLPKVTEDIAFQNAYSIEGCELPEIAHGNIQLSGLVVVKDLKLPRIVKGDVFLGKLKNAKNLELPEIVHGDFYLSSYLDELDFSKTIVHGDVHLSNKVDLSLFREKYPDINFIH